jgi:hypothetical protein
MKNRKNVKTQNGNRKNLEAAQAFHMELVHSAGQSLEKVRRRLNKYLATALSDRNMASSGDGYTPLTDHSLAGGEAGLDFDVELGVLGAAATAPAEFPPDCQVVLDKARFRDEVPVLFTRPIFARAAVEDAALLATTVLAPMWLLGLLVGGSSRAVLWALTAATLLLLGSLLLKIYFSFLGRKWLVVLARPGSDLDQQRRCLEIFQNLSSFPRPSYSSRPFNPTAFAHVERYPDHSGEIRFYQTSDELIRDEWDRLPGRANNKRARLTHYPRIQMLYDAIFGAAGRAGIKEMARSFLDDDELDESRQDIIGNNNLEI